MGTPNLPALNEPLLRLTPELQSLLTTSNDEQAISEIHAKPALVAEVRNVITALRHRAMLPAGGVGVQDAVKSAFVLYPQPQDRSPEEWAVWWGLYTQALGDLPASALKAGMAAWIKSGAQFLPKPGELREIALKTPNPAALAYGRARKVIDADVAAEGKRRKQWDGTVRKIEAPVFNRDAPEVRAAATASYRADLARRSEARMLAEEAKPQGPSLHGELAPGSALTPQMQALVRRRAEDEARKEARGDEAR